MTELGETPEPKTILNFGAGVNSTALIIELVNRNMKPDYVIFADTGSEMPETYKHIERMKEWFKEKGLEFIIVKSKYDKPLYDYYFERQTMPWRQFRDCTDKFKKLPIMKFLKQFKPEGVKQYIGIGYDEPNRMRQSETKWIEFSYPLWEWKITREKCIDIIKQEGLEVPVKSGCFMCPYQNRESWKQLWKNHKDLFKKAKEMEEQNRSYPDNTLTFSYCLKDYEKSFREQRTLFVMGESTICNGWCMT
jgi:3'-phosphoadenosine 5'-phosphosulfate sulfotransferase (PAPS reductase)/FAD synthetase